MSDSPLLDVARLVDLVSEVSGADQASAVKLASGGSANPPSSGKVVGRSKRFGYPFGCGRAGFTNLSRQF